MLYIPNYNLLFLELPKCGTTTIKQAFINHCKKNRIKYINKNTTGLWETPDNYEYRHCNYTACEKFCKKNGIDINKTIIILPIRDPIERYKSAINFYKNIFKNINENNFINHKYYNNLFIWDNYIRNNEHNINFIRIEHLSNDYNLLFEKYNLPKILAFKRLNQGKKYNLTLKEDIINTIYKDKQFLYKNLYYK